MNPDCTGTSRLDITDGRPSLHLRIVVVDDGREVRTIVEGSPVGAVAIKVR